MNNRGNEYYKAREVQVMLGISKAKFYKWVRQGLIPKVILPGMRQGVYPRRDIDALLLSMSTSTSRLVFSRSSPADHIAEMAIDSKVFRRSFIFSLAERIAFQQKNEFTFHSLKVLDEVVGYISMFRFTDAMLTTILTGQRIEQDIKLKEVLPFERLEPFSIYIDAIAIDPTLSAHLRHLYAGVLVSRFIDLLLNLLANGYQITHIYTVTSTVEGDNLVRKLDFKLMEGKSLVPGRKAYKYSINLESVEQLRSLSHRNL